VNGEHLFDNGEPGSTGISESALRREGSRAANNGTVEDNYTFTWPVARRRASFFGYAAGISNFSIKDKSSCRCAPDRRLRRFDLEPDDDRNRFYQTVSA